MPGAVELSLRHQGSLRSLVRRPTALIDHRQPDRRTLRPAHQRPLTARMPPPPRSGLRREDAAAVGPQHPASETRPTPFSPVAYTSRSDQPRAAPSAAAPAGRRRAASMSSPPAARRRPSVTAHSGHIPTRARGRTVTSTVQVKDALCSRKRPDRGGGDMPANAARCAGVRTAH